MSQPYRYPESPGPSAGRPHYVGPEQQPPANWPANGYPPGQNPYQRAPYQQAPYQQAPYQQAAPAPYATPSQLYPVLRRPMQRPAAVTMAAVMTVTASLQFVCALSFVWLVVVAGLQDLPTTNLGADSAIYHLLRQFHLALLDGLVYPLYLAPVAAFVLGFMILIPRSWTRWAFTTLGVVVLAWSAVWLHRQFVYWIPAALYVLVACLIVWTPGATAWYRARGRAA